MNYLRCMLLAGATAFGAAGAAQAAVIEGANFTNGEISQTIGGILWTATAVGPVPASFQQKVTFQGPYTGVGINSSAGPTSDEIDIGETLTGTSATAFGIRSIRIGVLYNGPEFGDYLETAEITVNLGSLATLLLTTTLTEDSATLTGINPALATVTNLSSTNGGGAVFEIVFNPTLAPVNTISFTAQPGACGYPPCTNQSDFTLVQMTTTAVPEPGTLALLGMGLLGLGVIRRRSRQLT